MKKVFFVLLMFFISFLALAVALVGALFIFRCKILELSRAPLEALGSSVLRTEVSIGRIYGDPFCAVTVLDLKIPGFAQIGRCEARYDLIPLFKRKFELKSLRIYDGSFFVLLDKEGKVNWIELIRPFIEGPPARISFILGTVKVENLSISFEDRIYGMRLKSVIPSVHVMATHKGYKISLSPSGLSGGIKGFSISGKMKALAEVVEGDIKVDLLELSAIGSKLKISGKIEPPRLNLHAILNVFPGKAPLDILGIPKGSISGAIFGGVRVSGPMIDPLISVSLKSRKLSISRGLFPEPFRERFKGPRIDLERLKLVGKGSRWGARLSATATALGSRLHAFLSSGPLFPIGSVSYKGQAKVLIGISHILDMLELPIPKPLKGKGYISVFFSGKGFHTRFLKAFTSSPGRIDLWRDGATLTASFSGSLYPSQRLLFSGKVQDLSIFGFQGISGGLEFGGNLGMDFSSLDLRLLHLLVEREGVKALLEGCRMRAEIFPRIDEPRKTKFSGTLSVEEAELMGQRLGKVEAEFKGTFEKLFISHLYLLGPLGKIGARGWIDMAGLQEFDFEVTDFLIPPELVPEIGGRVLAKGKVEGDIRKPSLQVAFKACDIRAKDIGIGDVDGSILMKEWKLAFDMTALEGDVRASGTVDLAEEDLPFHSEILISELDPIRRFSEVLPKIPERYRPLVRTSGGILVDGAFRKIPDSLSMAVEIGSLQARLGNLELRNDGAMMATAIGNVCVLDSLKLKGNCVEEISIGGRIQWPSETISKDILFPLLDLKIIVSGLEMGMLTDWIPEGVAKRIPDRIREGPTLLDVDGVGSGSLRKFDLFGSIFLRSKPLDLKTSGVWSVTIREGELKETKLDLISALDLNLSALSGILPDVEGIAGKVSGIVSARGAVGDPEISGHLDIDLERISVKGMSGSGVKGYVDFEGSKELIRTWSMLEGGVENIRGIQGARFGLKSNVELKPSSKAEDFIKGISGWGIGEGSIVAYGNEVLLRFPEISMKGGWIEARRAVVRKGEEEISVDLELDSISGKFGLRAEGKDMEIHNLIQGLGIPFETEGKISLDLKGGGELRDPRISMDWGMKDLRIGGISLGEAGGQASLKGDRILGRISAKLVETDLMAEADIPLDPKSPTLFARISVPSLRIRKLGDLIGSDVRMRGKARGYLEVRGSMKDPIPSGEISISHGRLGIPETELVLDRISGAIILKGDSIDITGISCFIGDKELRISGEFDFKGRSESPLRIRAVGSDIGLPLRKGIFVELKKIDLSLTGSPFGKMRISGDIVGSKALYSQDIKIRDILKDLTSRRVQMAGRVSEIASNVDLHLIISFPRDILLDNNLGKMEIKADMLVSGTLQHPVVLGRAEAISGMIRYAGTGLNLEKAVLEFSDPLSLNPTIDISSWTEIGGTKVFLKVTGDANKPIVSLSSDPSMPQEDIISLLVLRGARPTAAGIAGRITEIMGEELGYEIERAIGRRIGLETLTLPTFYGLGQVGDLGISFGKKVSDKWEVLYSTRIDNPLISPKIVMKYSPRKGIELRAERDEKGRYGVDVELRW